MPTKNQITYLEKLVNEIREPILIVGSKEYDFDKLNFKEALKSWKFKKVFGVDIQQGDGVDVVADMTDTESAFVTENFERFPTIICMQMLYATKNPFDVARNIERLLNKNGRLIFSDVYNHKIARIPDDYWRFTYDAHKLLFPNLVFDDSKALVGITRADTLQPLSYPLPEVLKYSKHADENVIGYWLRKIARKFFSRGIFEATRFIPEISIFSTASKPSSSEF